MRWVERMEGLALAGPTSFGPLRAHVPLVLDVRPDPEAPLGPVLSLGPSGSAERRIVLSDAVARWEFTLPVLAPEIAPAIGGIFASSDERVVLAHYPFSPDAIAKARSSALELIVLGNARTLWNEGEPFVAAIGDLRRGLGAEPLLWAPRLALPHRLPLLAYLGIDLLDATETELRSSAGAFLDLTLGARAPPPATTEGPCDCDGCRDGGPVRLTRHGRAMLRRSLLETRAAVKGGWLRELVESRLGAEAAQVEHLRYADRGLADLLEERTPLTGTGRSNYNLVESYRRPEMARFRQRFLERYRPPPSKSVLLLVPCSRTKPYRVSPSHRRFARALDGLAGLERVHLVSVSSPLGLVPRELEDVPPARHYDVPVTGEWSATEREWVLAGLASLLHHGHYAAALLHLDPEEYAFLREAVPSTLPVESTVEDHRTTAGVALDRLRAATARVLGSLPTIRGGQRTVALEEFRALAAFQLGPDAAERLTTEPVRLVGRPWFLRLTDGHRDLATVREERGLLHLTVAGSERMGELLPRVDADPAIPLQGDLFAPGVRAADARIRTGDSVGIFQDGRLAGVGEAGLPGALMQQLRRGIAVKVRHHHHPPADSDLTEDSPPADEGR